MEEKGERLRRGLGEECKLGLLSVFGEELGETRTAPPRVSSSDGDEGEEVEGDGRCAGTEGLNQGTAESPRPIRHQMGCGGE